MPSFRRQVWMWWWGCLALLLRQERGLKEVFWVANPRLVRSNRVMKQLPTAIQRTYNRTN